MPPPSYAPPRPPGLLPQLLGPVTALVLPPTEPTDPRPGPGRIWTLTSSDLTLYGTRYHGYAQQDVNGRPTTTLHFTVDALEIKDLVQRGWLGNGRNLKAAGAPGSVSTIRNGPIDLYVLQLTGTLSAFGFPLVPLTLSPNTLLLPNLDLSFLKLPVLSFRDVSVRNVDLKGGDLRIPGARITQENEGHYEQSQSLTQGPNQPWANQPNQDHQAQPQQNQPQQNQIQQNPAQQGQSPPLRIQLNHNGLGDRGRGAPPNSQPSLLGEVACVLGVEHRC